MTLKEVKLELIEDNPYNPRIRFDQDKIKQLAHSIEEVGLQQVPAARMIGGIYQLAYGHMRKRAFVFLKREVMPLDILPLSDQDMYYNALHENLNRSDLKPVEIARSIDKFLEKFPDQKEADVGKSIGFSQSTISNMRRVLKLPADILNLIDEGKLSFSQGKELLVLTGVSGTNAVGVTVSDADMMKNAINRVGDGGQYPNTQEGIIRAIDRIASDYLFPLQNNCGSGRAVLFDTKACAKCPNTISTHPEKKQTNRWCIDPECYGRKRTEQPMLIKDAPASETKAPITETKAPITETKAPITETKAPITETETETKEITVEQSPSYKEIATKVGAGQADVTQDGTVEKKADILNASAKGEEELAAAQLWDQTVFPLDKKRMVLILMAQIEGHHVLAATSPYAKNPEALLWLSISPKTPLKNQTRDSLYDKLLKQSDSELAKLLVNFSLYSLMWHGDPAIWEPKLTELLKKIGVEVKSSV